MGTEREIEAYLAARVVAMGGISYHFTCPGNRGVPDRIIVLPDRRIGFLELKAPGEEPTPQQYRELHRLAALRCPVDWCDRTTEVDDFLDRLWELR